MKNTAQLIDRRRGKWFVFSQLVDRGTGKTVYFNQRIGRFLRLFQCIPKRAIADQDSPSPKSDRRFIKVNATNFIFQFRLVFSFDAFSKGESILLGRNYLDYSLYNDYNIRSYLSR